MIDHQHAQHAHGKRATHAHNGVDGHIHGNGGPAFASPYRHPATYTKLRDVDEETLRDHLNDVHGVNYLKTRHVDGTVLDEIHAQFDGVA